MTSLQDLTSDQQESFEQFLTITSWEGDNDLAIGLLESSNWNLEIAISRFYDSGGTINSTDILSTQQEAFQRELPELTSFINAINNANNINNLGHPAEPRLQSAPIVNSESTTNITNNGPLRFVTPLIVFPFWIAYRLGRGLIYMLSRLFPFLQRFTHFYPANQNASRAESRPINPKDTAARFIRLFEEQTSQSGVLPFFENGYAQAVKLAKRSSNFLFVLLESDVHDDTVSFNKNTMCNEDVVKFFHDNHFILWGGNVRESEANQVALALRCTQFPSIVIIADTVLNSSSTSLSSMQVLSLISGPVSPEDLISKLTHIVNKYSPIINRIKAARAEAEAARNLREQQDAAYEASLAADREREQQRNLELEKAKEEELKRQKEAEEKILLEEKKQQWIKWRASRIYPEPKIENSDNKIISRISIRLITGQRIIRRFDASLPIEELYAFVECYDIISNTQSSEEIVNAPKPENYTHKYFFDLVSPMPRKVFDYNSESPIKDEKLLFPSGNIIVESLEDISDEDEE